MARPTDTDRYELTDAEKREVELVWNGKTREVCTAILPFQTLEHIDEPRKGKCDAEELGLDTGGRQVKGWTNKRIESHPGLTHYGLYDTVVAKE